MLIVIILYNKERARLRISICPVADQTLTSLISVPKEKFALSDRKHRHRPHQREREREREAHTDAEFKI